VRAPARRRCAIGSVDPAAFRAALGQWPTGVALVTTVAGGTWHGVTASSFSSVSLEPPLVSVCLARTAFVHDLLLGSGVFGVTVLGKDHAELGRRFARFDPAVDRFADDAWETAKTGAPLLASALSWLDCQVASSYDAGDHTIFVGEVLAAATPRTTSPLLYHSRTWGQFADQLPDEVVVSVPGADDVVAGASDPASIDAAVATLAARSDVHERPRVLLRDAFSVGPQELSAAVAGLVHAAPGEIVLVDDGAATPVQVREACREAGLAARPVPLAVRLSDRSGLAQACLLTALKSGVSRLDLTDLAEPDVTRLVTSLGLHLQGATT
jgi:flavin reductase (DIM6/NTAB) family NADH-FMN oxidoreductase RutF